MYDTSKEVIQFLRCIGLVCLPQRVYSVEDAPKLMPVLEENKESVGMDGRWHGGIGESKVERDGLRGRVNVSRDCPTTVRCSGRESPLAAALEEGGWSC